MSVSLAFIIVVVCACLMRIKGGGLVPDSWPARWTSVIGFGILMGLVKMDAIFGLLAALAWLAALAPGLGSYINNLRENPEEKHLGDHAAVIVFMTFIFDRFKIPHTQFNYGFAGCFLRGIWMGIPLALCFSSGWPLLLAAQFPFAYLAGFWLDRKFPAIRSSGWEIGEFIYGAVVGVGVILA